MGKAELEAQVDYLRSPSVVKQMRDEGWLDNHVAHLVNQLEAADMEIPYHINGLANTPTVQKALNALMLIKSMGGAARGGGQAAKGKVKPEGPETQAAPGTVPTGNAPGKVDAPGVAANAQRTGQAPDKGANGAGKAPGAAVGGGWQTYKKNDDYAVKAKQMDKPFTAQTKEGPVKGKAGDYLVEGTEGEQWPVDKGIFEKTYHGADDAGAQPGAQPDKAGAQPDKAGQKPGDQPASALNTSDKTKGLEIVEGPSADDIFGAYEQWGESGTAHFAKPLVNLSDEQENGGSDEEVHVYGLKARGEWAGFAACTATDGTYQIKYLETAPTLREQIEGMGTRLLVHVLEQAATDQAKVQIDAMTETIPYFQATGAQNLGGTRFEFTPEASQALIDAMAATDKLQKSNPTAPDGYERRMQAKQTKAGGAKPGALDAKTILAAEKKLTHGLLIGPVHEAASARVARYYDPKQGTTTEKSLHITPISEYKGG